MQMKNDTANDTPDVNKNNRKNFYREQGTDKTKLNNFVHIFGGFSG